MTDRAVGVMFVAVAVAWLLGAGCRRAQPAESAPPQPRPAASAPPQPRPAASDPPQPRAAASAPPDPDGVDATLPCVVQAVLDNAHAADNLLDTIENALDVAPPLIRRGLHIDPARAARFALSLADASTGPERAPLHDRAGAVLAHAALELAEIGLGQDARRLVDRALAAETRRPDHDFVIETAAMVLAWTGDSQRALALAEHDRLAQLGAAQGMARAGDRAGARRALASATAKPDQSAPVRGMVAATQVWVGDLAAARAAVAAERDPRWRPSMQFWVAEAAVLSKHAEATAVVDSAITELRAAAINARDESDELLHLVVWTELVGLREQLGGTEAVLARKVLDDWLIAGDKRSVRRSLTGVNATGAQLAGQPAEADRLLASSESAGLGGLGQARIEIAMLRGDYPAAFQALADHQRERAQHRGDLAAAMASPIKGGADTAEVAIWLQLTSATRDAAILDRFRALACH